MKCVMWTARKSTVEQAQAIIAERYTVSPEVRRRTTKRHRQERTERQAERNSKGKVAEAW